MYLLQVMETEVYGSDLRLPSLLAHAHRELPEHTFTIRHVYLALRERMHPVRN